MGGSRGKSPQLRLLSPNYVGYPSRLPAYKSIVLALRKRILVVVGILLVVTASIIVIAWDASLSFCDYPFGATPSVTVSESKARGVWVVSLRAVPAKLTLPAKTVHIDAAWVEARSHRTERIWGFSERRLDGYSLCFTLFEGRIGYPYYFVPDDDGAGVGEIGLPTRYATDLKDAADATRLRLSLISGHEPRAKNIQFVTQP
jgi:hypothetical protein